MENSICDLEKALANEYQEQLAKVLGQDEHDAVREIVTAYLIASQEVNKSMGHCLHMPSRALKKAQRNLKDAFLSYLEKSVSKAAS